MARAEMQAKVESTAAEYSYTAVEAAKLPPLLGLAAGKAALQRALDDDHKSRATFDKGFDLDREYLLELPKAEWADVHLAVEGAPGRLAAERLNYLTPEEVKRCSLALRAVVPPPMQAALRKRIAALYPETAEGDAKRRERFQACIGDFAKLRAFYEFAALGNQAVIVQGG